MNTEEEFQEEVIELLNYLEERGLSERESCSVIGETIVSLIADKETARKFLHILQSRLLDAPNTQEPRL